MDVLENKSKKNYTYISRYSKFYYYYNKLDDKYIYGITSNLSKDTHYVIHKIKDYDTLDILSLTYYGRPDFYWIIADYNDIKDPFLPIQKYRDLKIPTLTEIYFKE